MSHARTTGLHFGGQRYPSAICTVCRAPLDAPSINPHRLDGVCSVACYNADAPRRARFQDPTWRP